MPSLIINGDTVSIRLSSKHLELVKRDPDSERAFIKKKVPLFDVDRAVVIGRPNISIPVLQRLMFYGIPTYFVTSKGRWIGSLTPDNNMNAQRRITQYHLSSDKQLSLKIAKKLVYAKIRNSRRVLQRLAANRKLSDDPEHCKVVAELKNYSRLALLSDNLDSLRGYEGISAAKYFSRLATFFPDNIPFEERSTRPPKNAANALMSWTYTIVLGEVEAAVRCHGLDTCIGFLHTVSHGTPSLALDLLELLRAPLCDLLVMNILNHNILTDESFEFHADDGGTYLKNDSKKDFFFSYEMAMNRKFKLKQGEPHTDFRKIIDNSVISILHALEKKDFSFFIMP